MSAVNRPSVVVLAGPNGAGKSTIAPRVLPGALAVSEFVNADMIARGLSGFNPEGVAVAAGRIMLERVRELAAQRASFAFETTLASRSFAPWIRELVAAGYEFHLVYVWLPHADLSVERVAGRVQRGGHSVPEPVIRRRYLASLRNFFELYRPLATTWQVYDNSSENLRLVASGEGTEVVTVEEPVTWSRIEASGQMWREVRMKRDELSQIGRLMLEGTEILEAARQAVREAILDRIRAGLPIVVERDGRIVWISAEDADRELKEGDQT